MKKILFLSIFFLILIPIENVRTNIDSKTVEMIIKNEKLIFVNNETNQIKSFDINTNNEITIYNNEITKNKVLINLNEQKFIMFGFSNDNKFLYQVYNDISSNNSPIKSGNFGLTFLNPINYVIRMVSENIYILSYINDNNFIVFSQELDKTSIGGRKPINNYNNNIHANTIECDSFDGKNIFCVYSLIEYNNYGDDIIGIQCFYSFKDIEETNLERNEIKANSETVSSVSLAKFENNNEKKFIVCFIYVNGRDSTIYCQFFVQKGNEISIDTLYKIGDNAQLFLNRISYVKNIPIKIKVFNYSIYLFLEMTRSGDSKIPVLYACSLDLGLNFPVKIDEISYTGNQDFLVNDKYIVLIERYDSGNTRLEYISLYISCNQNEIYQFNTNNQNSGIDITNDIVVSYNNVSMSFSLDLLTYLFVDDIRNMGGLLNEIRMTNYKFKINYNHNLIKTNNYYIYYSKSAGGNYILTSNFCYFKVVNCYDTCIECNSNVQGTIEIHQCKTCISNYYKYENEQNENGFYNCYHKDDPKVNEGVYFNETDNFYHKCDISCKKCKNGNSCITCNNGYYFKEESRIGNSLNDKCYNATPEYYYLNTTYNIEYNGNIINFVYKKCYDTCQTCLGDGNIINNRCIKCRDNNINYPFDSTKCTINKDDCLNNNKFWIVDENNNINCIDSCSKYLIFEGDNRNQCIDNCQSYFNPYEIRQLKPMLTYSCDSYKYCVTLETCKAKKLNNDNEQCFPPVIGCVNITNYTPEESSSGGDQTRINNRVKFIKLYEYENTNYSQFTGNFITNQTTKYNNELIKELNSHIGEYLNGIDFITSSNYKDFTITIYPLKDEEYVYKNLLEINNLCSINFTKLFQNINYQINNQNYIILVAIIEFKKINIPINPIDYFLILYDEINNIPITQIELNKNYSSLSFEVSYPLHNFENANINEKYSKNLISTIKDLNNIDPDLNFNDKNSKLFNDICYVFTSKENTDITIEDRIKDYYQDLSLCEKNCVLMDVYDKSELKNPRSLCNCKIIEKTKRDEENYSFFMNENFMQKKSNINALKCAKQTFSRKKVVSNPLFWIYIILLFIECLLFVNIICCGKLGIEYMLKIKKLNKPGSKNNDIGGNTINRIDSIKKEEFNNNKYKSVRIYENIKKSVNSIDDYKKNVYQTSPHKISHPPRKKIINKENKTSKMKNNDTTENRGNSNNETSLFENNQIYSHYDQNNSFEDIYDGDSKAKKNNYFKNEKNFIENNYLVYKRKIIFNKIKTALNPLDKKEFDKYKYINTNYGDIDPYKKQKRSLFLSEIDDIRKRYYSEDDKLNSLPNFNNFSNIKNNLTKNISKFSKIYGEDSDILGDDKSMKNDNKEKSSKDSEEDEYDNNIINNQKFKSKNNKKNSKNLNKKVKNDLSNEDNILSITQRSKNSNYMKSERSELIKIKNKNNSSMKSSLNMSSNSNNKFLSNKNDIKYNLKINPQNVNSDIYFNSHKTNGNEENNFNKNQILSSITDMDNNPETGKSKNCINFYWNYFIQREIFLSSFYNKHENIALFIRITTFFLVMTFIFALNCLLLTNTDIHNRYIYAKEHAKIKEMKYTFGHEFLLIFLCALISNVIKIVCIKILYGTHLFRISRTTKEELSPFYERNMNNDEFYELYKKRESFIISYSKKSMIYIAIVIILLLFFGYITVCYIGTFPNTFAGIILRFFISLVLSFIVCALICFIIVIIYWIGKKLDLSCLICFFNFIKKIY